MTFMLKSEGANLNDLFKELQGINDRLTDIIQTLKTLSAYGLPELRGIRAALEKQSPSPSGSEVPEEAERTADSDERLAPSNRMGSSNCDVDEINPREWPTFVEDW